MEPELWKAIQVLFATMERAFGFREADWDSDNPSDIQIDPENLIKARSEIRKGFDDLRITLLGSLSEQETYQVLFPLVVYVDELVQARYFGNRQVSWPLLQMELYEVDDGGRLFYDTLDSILKKTQTSQFVYEVHYFCLKHGFEGKYVADPVRINKYLEQLKEKIAISDMDRIEIMAEETGEMKYFASPVWLYAGVLICLIPVYCLFKFLA